VLKLFADNLNTTLNGNSFYRPIIIIGSIHEQNMKLYENLLEFVKVTSHLSHSLSALSITRGSVPLKLLRNI